MDDKIFVSELNKPELNEDTLAHYGVLGMKWGVRKNPEKAFAKAAKKSDKYAKKIYKTNKKYLKEAKKVSRFFGRKRAQNKVVRLNAKKDYLTSKKDKWDKNVEKRFIKEYDRIKTKSKSDNERNLKLKNLREGYDKGRTPNNLNVKKWDTAASAERKANIKKLQEANKKHNKLESKAVNTLAKDIERSSKKGLSKIDVSKKSNKAAKKMTDYDAKMREYFKDTEFKNTKLGDYTKINTNNIEITKKKKKK